jgi:hypothetical protein
MKNGAELAVFVFFLDKAIINDPSQAGQLPAF